MLRLHTHAATPQPRHIKQVGDVLRAGGLAIYPTDTTYGLGCDLYSKRSVDRIYQLKGLERSHRFSFLCHDISQIARYAVIEDRNHRLLRHHLPGKYTFILPATREVPKIIQTKTRTVGVRIPDSPICLALIEELGHPIISTTVGRSRLEGTDYLNDPDDMARALARSVEILIDVGPLNQAPSSVVDLTGPDPVILREGSGELSWLEVD